MIYTEDGIVTIKGSMHDVVADLYIITDCIMENMLKHGMNLADAQEHITNAVADGIATGYEIHISSNEKVAMDKMAAVKKSFETILKNKEEE